MGLRTQPVFLVTDGDQGSDPLLSVMARLSEVRNASIVPQLREPSLSNGNPSADRKRWPVELLRTREAGFLAIRVHQPNAGLEPYGIGGGDILIFAIEDPEPGSAAFAAINDEVVVGRYSPRRNDRFAIVPYVKGTAPVIAGENESTALCALKAIVRDFKEVIE